MPAADQDLCQFVRQGRVNRCLKCGFIDRLGRDPAKVFRQCDRLDLRRAPYRGRQRGLGDTIAAGLSAVGIEQKSCGCGRRQELLNRWVPYEGLYRALDAAIGRRPIMLLKFPHGFGDAVQLTTVLLHLRARWPRWRFDVACKRGAHTLFAGLAERVIVCDSAAEVESAGADQPERYALARRLDWHEPAACWPDSPATKAEQCLRRIFGLEPVEALCRYQIAIDREVRQRVDAWLVEAGLIPEPGELRTDPPLVAIHYQGNSAAALKNFSELVVRRLVKVIRLAGAVPMILDWERPPRSGLVRRGEVLCPGPDSGLWDLGVGDGQTLAALIERAALFVGIDSGPGHVAAATRTPALIVWRGLHPVNYFGLAENVLHLVPRNRESLIFGRADEGETYFRARYPHRQLRRNLRDELPELVGRFLAGESLLAQADHHPPGQLVEHRGHWVRWHQEPSDRGIVAEHLDQDVFRLAELPDLVRPVWIDIGGHIGAAVLAARRRFGELGYVLAIDPEPSSQAALRANLQPLLAQGRAEVIEGAVSYERGRLVLASCDNSTSITLVKRRGTTHPIEATSGPQGHRWRESRLPRRQRFSLEQLLRRLPEAVAGRPIILKLDCEGSERSILERAPLEGLARFDWIVGEWHGGGWFAELVARRFADWELTIHEDHGHLGLFWLRSPAAVRRVRKRAGEIASIAENSRPAGSCGPFLAAGCGGNSSLLSSGATSQPSHFAAHRHTSDALPGSAVRNWAADSAASRGTSAQVLRSDIE